MWLLFTIYYFYGDLDVVPQSNNDLPPQYQGFSEQVRVFVDGDVLVIRTKDIPNHPSPYFLRHEKNYEVPHQGMKMNPNRIFPQDYEFRIPLKPKKSKKATDTRLDAIGVARNGVVFFNQYAGRGRGGFFPLEREIESFDRYNGHPAQRGNYHYHLNPIFLTKENPGTWLGVMLDGFPLYGPMEVDGNKPKDLDDCNGHTHATKEYPDGIYHYHITENAPYIAGCFKGEPGTVTN